MPGFIGIVIGVLAAGHCSAARSLQLIDQSRGEQTHNRKEEGGQRWSLKVDVASTTCGDRSHDCEEEKHSSKTLNITVFNPDGDRSYQQIHEERPHARKEDCPEASWEHSRRGYPADDNFSDNNPPDKKGLMLKMKSGKVCLFVCL